MKRIDIINYRGGGTAKVVDGFTSHIKYNTGDQIWVKCLGNTVDDDRYKVVKIKTHDGWYWRSGMKGLISIREFWATAIPAGLLALMIVGLIIENIWFRS